MIAFMGQDKRSEVLRDFVATHRMFFEKSNEKYIYLIGLAVCLIAHVSYLIIFMILHVWEMMYFNIFSVAFYLGLMIATPFLKEKLRFIIYVVSAEVIAHAAAATYLMGMAPDFTVLMLVIIPISFLMLKDRFLAPYMIAASSMGLFLWLRIRTLMNADIKYSMDDHGIVKALYIINALVGVCALVYILTIYLLFRVNMEYKLTQQSEEFKKAASIDPLTQLFNRRAMNEKIREIRRNSITPRSRYVIGIGDIDNFKQINDTYGHDTGDKVLVYVANLFISLIPEGGYSARWGGEEFLFVLPESQIVDGLDFTDKLHKSLRAHTFEIDDCLFGVTMTFGVSEGIPTDKIDTVITHADKRLYKGKNNGKNHTEYTD